MPPVIGVGAAFIAYEGLIAFGASTFFAGVGAAFASGLIASQMARRKSPALNNDLSNRQVLVRSSVEPRRIVYGEVGGLSGPLVFAHVSRDFSGAVWNQDVVPEGAPFTITANQIVFQHSYIDLITTEFDLDGRQTLVHTRLTQVSSNPGPGEYSLAGQIYTFNAAQAGQNVWIFFLGPQTVANAFLHLVIPVAGHQVEQISDLMLGTDLITDDILDAGGNVASGKYTDHVRIKKYLGTADQLADPDLIAETGGKWTADHRGRGVAYIYIRLRRNPDLFPQGVPPIRVKVKGALLYDPRTQTTAWSDNWALVMYDYLTKSYGFGCAAAEINTTAINAAANISDETVELDAGLTSAGPATQARYTANGTISLDQRPLDVLKELVMTGAGGAIYSVSTWDVYAGAYTAPVSTLTISDLAGPISGSADLERRDLFNGVRGTFISRQFDWQERDFAPVRNASYVANDNGDEVYRDIQLPFVTDELRGQRLAKILLERARQATQAHWPGKPRLFRWNVWETMNLEVAQLGWNPKVARIVGWTWQPGGGVELMLQEEAAAIYDWNFGEATADDPAPNTALPDPFVVLPPGKPVVTSELRETHVGVELIAVVSWAASPDAYVDEYRVRYKRAADAAWKGLGATRDLNLDVYNLEPGVYDWQVSAINSFGRRSLWMQTRAELVDLAAGAPATPVIAGAQVAGNQVILTVQPAEEADVLHGGRWLVRFYQGTIPGSDAWELSFSIGEREGYPANNPIMTLPLKPGSYLVKSQDATGRESVDFAFTEVSQDTLIDMVSDFDIDVLGDDFFTSQSGTVFENGILKLAASGIFDDIPDLDAVASLDGFGGIVPEGTRTCGQLSVPPFFNLSVRVTSEIVGEVVNELDIFDQREAAIDDWGSFDGGGGGSAGDAWLELEHAESPGFDYRRLDCIELQTSGPSALRTRIQLRSRDPAYNVLVSLAIARTELA